MVDETNDLSKTRAGGGRRPTAFVTGASGGIGEAITRALLASHQVYATGRDAARLATLPGIDDGCHCFAEDLTDFDGFRERAPQIDSLDVLVHSAGVAIEAPFEDLPLAAWSQTYAVNVLAAINVTQHYLSALRRAKGIVIFINSGSGLFSYARGAAYTASKFALRAAADCLREDERGSGVRVTSIHPGFVDTRMGRSILSEQGISPEVGSLLDGPTIAAMVRAAVDTPPEAQIEMLSIRPSARIVG